MTPLRLGFIPLSDCAVLAVALEKGFFRRHGLDVVLSREVSWANIRDKTAVGVLDGAQMLAGMPLAAAAGIDPVACPLVTAFSLGLNGNAITVSTDLWKRMRANDPEGGARPTNAALRRVVEENRRLSRPPLRLAMVYPFSTHNYELRYWLAAAGIDPDSDVELTVVPPPRMVEALERGLIDGFCVGEPWGSLAVDRRRGGIATTKYEIWNNSPEKVLALNRKFAEREPRLHQALVRALIEAAVWTDAPENRLETSRMLAAPQYLNAPAALLAKSLVGQMTLAPGEAAVSMPDFHVFHRYAANYPWISHGVWLLAQMMRWGQLTSPIDLLATAATVYRPDLYRAAANDVGVAAPNVDFKPEGVHSAAWQLAGVGGSIAMGSDLFCDGRVFDASDLMGYLAGFSVGAPRMDFDALAALNP